MIALASTAGLAFLALSVAWLIAVTTGRFSWIDAIWSLSVGVCGIVVIFIAPDVFGREDSVFRQVLVASLAAFWSLRLGMYLVHRSIADGRDPRYLQLQREWRGSFRARLFWFLQIQAVIAVVLAYCLGIAASRGSPTLVLGDGLGLAISAMAIAGEHIADRQLRQFRARAGGRPAICSIGFWSLSRHPNYFFEWLFWIGIAVIGIDPSGSYNWGWLGIGAPVLMYWLLVKVSGIPPLEAHMLQSRGEEYRSYQRQVRAFWPWPGKQSAVNL